MFPSWQTKWAIVINSQTSHLLDNIDGIDVVANQINTAAMLTTCASQCYQKLFSISGKIENFLFSDEKVVSALAIVRTTFGTKYRFSHGKQPLKIISFIVH